jgi:hypothetical protein
MKTVQEIRLFCEGYFKKNGSEQLYPDATGLFPNHPEYLGPIDPS